jgi:hypothetical protein
MGLKVSRSEARTREPKKSEKKSFEFPGIRMDRMEKMDPGDVMINSEIEDQS